MKQILSITIIAIISFSSCRSTYQVNYKPNVQLKMDTLSYANGDYSIMDMMTTEVTIKYVLGITFNNSSFNYRYNLNTGEVLNMMNATRLDKGIDLARYQLAKENPDVDMFINYQLLHRMDNRVKFLGLTLSKNSVIKIGAKGIEYRLN